MFSPELSCTGRPVVLCERRATAAGDQFKHWLTDAGMVVTHMEPDEHDRAMAVCQTLPHAIIVAFLLSLSTSLPQMKNLLSLAPPPMQTLMCLAARLLGNNPAIYWDIQHGTAHSAAQRDHVTRALLNLQTWANSDDSATFTMTLDHIRQSLTEITDPYAVTCERPFNSLNESRGNAINV
jgi:prephenate dehydrogenase